MKTTILTSLLLTTLTSATPLKRQDAPPPGAFCADTGVFYFIETCIEACVVPETGEKGTCASFNGSDILFECTCPEDTVQVEEKRQDDLPGLVCPDTGAYYFEETCIEACVVPETGEKGTCAPWNNTDNMFQCTCPK